MAKNFGYGTVLTAPSPATSGTSLVLNSGQGALFPPVPFNATIWPAGVQPTATNAEVVTVTAISTDTLTITRIQEGTSARTVIVGDQVAATITANSVVQTNRFTSQSATTQNITLDASADFLSADVVEVGGAYSLEVPTTSTLEVAGYYSPANPTSMAKTTNPIKFAYYSTTAQNSGNAAFAQTLFQVKEYDTSNNVISSTFTAPVTGWYHFDGAVTSSSGATIWIVSLFKNGAEFKRGGQYSYATALNACANVSVDLQLIVGDTIDIRTFGDSARAINVTQATCYFMGRLTSLT